MLVVDSREFSVHGFNNVFIESKLKGAFIDASSADGGNFTLTAAGNLVQNGNILASTGSIIINAGANSITSTQVSNVVSAGGTISLDGGNIGTAAVPIQIDTASVALNSSDTVFVKNLGSTPILLVAPKIDKGLAFTSAGDIQVENTVGASTNTNTLIESTGGNILQGTTIGANFGGASVTLKADAGNIGNGSLQPVTVNAKVLTLTAPNGSVTVMDNQGIAQWSSEKAT